MTRQALVLVTALLILGAAPHHLAHGFSSGSSSSFHRNKKRFTATTTSALHSSLSNNDYSYLRWNKPNDNNNNNNNKWELQTAVTVFQHPTTHHTMELHAQLHFGDKEYFSYYNTREFQDRCDAIHYELLVDEDLLTYDQDHQQRRVLKEPIHIQASPNDERFAQSYGWHCQVNCIDYTTPSTTTKSSKSESSPNNNKWIHADLTRQEFIQLLDQTEDKADSSSSSETNKPLWQLATNGPSPQSSSAAAEAVSALLVGPPTLSFYNNLSLKRRLFTNLFLPGDALANGLRALLWMTVPAPELSILLLDWSSLLPTTQNSKTNNKNSAIISQVAVPLLTSLTRWDWMAMRRLVFGQMIVASTNSQDNKNDNQSWSLLVTKRNDHALDVVQQTLLHSSSSSSENTTVALLYGSSHCPDLHRKLVHNLGFVPIQTEWRTAWSIDIMDNHNSDGITTRREEDSSQSSSVLPPTMSRSWTTTILPILILYLGIGALDWMELLGDVSSTASGSGEYWNVVGICGLYLVRHVLLYLGWSKFLVDWK